MASGVTARLRSQQQWAAARVRDRPSDMCISMGLVASMTQMHASARMQTCIGTLQIMKYFMFDLFTVDFTETSKST